MSEFNISIPGGESKRLKTGGTYCPADILVTAEKSGPVVEKDVNFYDYDGELLYSYSLEEAQALTELPPAPTPKRDFLDFDEWNWTLEQIKSINLPVDVGATYKTKDEKTYLVIEVTDPARMEITLNYAQWCPSIKVDWGDGSAEEETTQSGGVNVTKKHTYSGLGKYTITINADGTWNAAISSAGLVGTSNTDYRNSEFLKEVYICKGARLISNAFAGAVRLEMAMFSKQAQFNIAWSSWLRNCYRLKAAIIPSTCIGLGAAVMENCNSLTVSSLPYSLAGDINVANSIIKKITIPPPIKMVTLSSKLLEKVWFSEGLETLYFGCFSNCLLLNEIELPASLKNINNQCFYNCSQMKKIKFKSETPPTVTHVNAFTNIPTYCVIEVPTGSLETYKNATNYGTIAAQMVGV